MRYSLLGMLLAGLMVSGCNASIKNPVTAADMYKAELAYDAAVLVPAAHYATLPRCNVHPAPCSRLAVVLKLRKYDAIASAAMRRARSFIRNNPTLDASSVINAAITAISAARAIASANGVK